MKNLNELIKKAEAELEKLNIRFKKNPSKDLRHKIKNVEQTLVWLKELKTKEVVNENVI